MIPNHSFFFHLLQFLTSLYFLTLFMVFPKAKPFINLKNLFQSNFFLSFYLYSYQCVTLTNFLIGFNDFMPFSVILILLRLLYIQCTLSFYLNCTQVFEVFQFPLFMEKNSKSLRVSFDCSEYLTSTSRKYPISSSSL